MNDWMDTHAFQEGAKVQGVCLMLVGKARLWYESPRHIALDWNVLQAKFWQQYSRIGNTREQLFHVKRSFHFDENSETIDNYITHIRQVAILLGYEEPQVLEGFKNTLPSRLYWVLFPVDRGRRKSREREFLGTFRRNDRSSSRPRLGSRASTNRVGSFIDTSVTGWSVMRNILESPQEHLERDSRNIRRHLPQYMTT